MFEPLSRYYELETAKITATTGREVTYKRRRFLPPVKEGTLLAEHSVTQGDRVDNVTARYLGEAEQFWKLCDSNNVMHPQELTAKVGNIIKIVLPEI